MAALVASVAWPTIALVVSPWANRRAAISPHHLDRRQPRVPAPKVFERHLQPGRPRNRSAALGPEDLHHRVLSGGHLSSPEADFAQHRRLPDRSLERTGVHPG